MNDSQNIVILDLESLNNPDSLPDGWNDKAAIGISIGAYYSYLDNQIHFFDFPTLEKTVTSLTMQKPRIVTFCGTRFDLKVMRALLRQKADTQGTERRAELKFLCDEFKKVCEQGYDILSEIQLIDKGQKRVKGTNTLNNILIANALGKKIGEGKDMPGLWKQGQYATVVNYLVDEIYKLRKLYEHIIRNEGMLLRLNAQPVKVRVPK
jgi:hypothetical protein